MDNIIIVNFKVESEAYQAITELKSKAATGDYVVSQALLVKKTDGKINTLDALDTGVESVNDTHIGGLIGALLGIAGGPLGMLIMGEVGALIGSAVDLGDTAQNASLMEHVLDCVTDDNAVIIAVVQENNGPAFDQNFAKFDAEVTRFDLAEVTAEIEEAEKVQKEMAREAKKRIREAKKKESQPAIEEKK